MYLWAKALHFIFIVTWFAGLFYLPRLYVYHTESKDKESTERFKIMEARLYLGIMLPAILLTISSGITLIWIRGWDWLLATSWMHLKLLLVLSLIIFHIYLGLLRKDFARDTNQKSTTFFKILNEMPVLILVLVTLLAVLKPQ
tara:strand:- start:3014 stop:3442 length:429 start_codon:yes stop_codon:yes gene_type:complete